MVIQSWNNLCVNCRHSGKPVLQAKLIALAWVYLEAHEANNSQMADYQRKKVKKKKFQSEKDSTKNETSVCFFVIYNIKTGESWHVIERHFTLILIILAVFVCQRVTSNASSALYSKHSRHATNLAFLLNNTPWMTSDSTRCSHLVFTCRKLPVRHNVRSHMYSYCLYSHCMTLFPFKSADLSDRPIWQRASGTEYIYCLWLKSGVSLLERVEYD